MNLLTYLMLTIVINYVCDCTIWGYYPLGIPAVLTAQYILLNLKSMHFIVLCVYPEKYTSLRVWHPGLSGPSRTIARWLRDAYKTNL